MKLLVSLCVTVLLLVPRWAAAQDGEDARALMDPAVNAAMGIPSEEWPSIFDILDHPYFDGGRAARDVLAGVVLKAHKKGVLLPKSMTPHPVRVTFDFPKGMRVWAKGVGMASPIESVISWAIQMQDPDITPDAVISETACTAADVFLTPFPLGGALVSSACAAYKTRQWAIKKSQGLDAEVAEEFLMTGPGRTWLEGTGASLAAADPSALAPFVDDFITSFIDPGLTSKAPGFGTTWLRYTARPDTYANDITYVERTMQRCFDTLLNPNYRKARGLGDLEVERRDCYSDKLQSAVASYLRQEYMRTAKAHIDHLAYTAVTPEAVAELVLAANLARVATQFPNAGPSVQKVLTAIADEDAEKARAAADEAAAEAEKAEAAREKALADLQNRPARLRLEREAELVENPHPPTDLPPVATPSSSTSAAPTGGPLPSASGWHWWTDSGSDIALRFPDNWRTGDPDVYAPSFCADSARLQLTRGGSAGGGQEWTNGYTWLDDDPGTTERRVTIKGPQGSVLGSITSRHWKEYSEQPGRAACRDLLATMGSQPFPASGDGLATHNASKGPDLFTIHNGTSVDVELYAWVESTHDYHPDNVPLGLRLGPGQRVALTADELVGLDPSSPVKSNADSGFLILGSGNEGLRARGSGVCRLRDSYPSGATWTIQAGSDGGCN